MTKANAATNGHSNDVKQESTPPSSFRDASSADIKSPPSESDEDEAPPKKKVKKEKGAVDDAKLAAMLQAQENRTGRATRGAGNKKVVKTKRTPKKPRKSASKVKAADDSDVELGSDGEVKEKPKKGGFHKQYHLSAPLADLVGEPTVCDLFINFLEVFVEFGVLGDWADEFLIIAVPASSC